VTDAVEQLRKAGYRAYRMEHGVMDWRARGWRLQRGQGSTNSETSS
jgi:hypothetical protein